MVNKRTIYFNESLHQYKDEFNKVYTSVTTLIGKYHPQFDENYWAKRKAKELGTTEALIKQSWKAQRDYACDKGNKVHKEIENSINDANGKAQFDLDGRTRISSGYIVINVTNLYILANSPLAIKYPLIYRHLKHEIEDGWVLYAEKRIYWADYLIAGTIDCLLIKGKLFQIVDWKTNKDELKFKSGYYQKLNGIKTDRWIDKKEYFFNPVSNLEYCKGNVYSMQLSLYAYILELWGYRCITLTLFHIRDTQEPKPYNITYRKSEAQLLLVDSISIKTQSSSNNYNTKRGNSFGIT